jgi:hypothetical protein
MQHADKLINKELENFEAKLSFQKLFFFLNLFQASITFQRRFIFAQASEECILKFTCEIETEFASQRSAIHFAAKACSLIE